MKLVDFDALIDVGLFRRKPKAEREVAYTAKKENDLPPTIDSTDFEAGEADNNTWEDYTQKMEPSLAMHGKTQFLEMLKYLRTSEPITPGRR